MTLEVKNNVVLDELYYSIKELKKTEENVSIREYYSDIYDILSYQLEFIDYNSIFEAVEKNYIILNISSKISDNNKRILYYKHNMATTRFSFHLK